MSVKIYAVYYGGRTPERGGKIVIRLPHEYAGHAGLDLAEKINSCLNKPDKPKEDLKAQPQPAKWQETGNVTVRDITDAWKISISTWKKYVVQGRYPKPLPKNKGAAINAPNRWNAAEVTKALRRDKVQRRMV